MERSSQTGADTDTTLSEIIGELSNKSVSLTSEYDSSENDTGIRNYAADDRWKQDDNNPHPTAGGETTPTPQQSQNDFFADNADDSW